MESKAEKKREETEDESEESEFEVKNIFTEPLIYGKRHHNVCSKNDELIKTWLDEHVEVKEKYKLKQGALYEAYVDMCVANSVTNAALEPEFQQVVRKLFPEGHGLKEDSSLQGKIKEIKMKEKKPREPSAPKVDIKAILKEAFMDLKNPREGVSYIRLKKFLISHHPDLHYDTKPMKVLTALQGGMRRNFVRLVTGLNRMGKYRFWSEKVEEEDKKLEEEEKRLLKEKREAIKKEKEEAKAKDGEAGTDGKNQDKAAKVSKNDKVDDDDKEEKDKPIKKKKKRKNSFSMNGDYRPSKRSKSSATIVHGDPQRIEHTFPLAITYMSEPKESTAIKIGHYFQKYYRDFKEEKLQQALANGESKGYWAAVRGSGKHTVYQLTVDSFDPTDDKDAIGKLINAIVGSHEPKVATALSIRDYVTEFHPEFKVAGRPYLFKRALERGIQSGIVKRMSGIGATGSLAIEKVFLPSPGQLAGKDEASDYEVSGVEDNVQIDESAFQDAYKPRATKRHGRSAAAGFDKNASYMETASKAQFVSSSRKRMIKKRPAVKRKMMEESSDEDLEEESEEERKPPKKQRKLVKKPRTPVKQKKAATKPASKRRSAPRVTPPPESCDEDPESEEEALRGRSSGRAQKRLSAASAKNRHSISRKQPLNRSYREESSSEEEPMSSADEAPPRKSPASAKGRSPKKVKASTTPTVYKTSRSSFDETPKLVTPASRKLYPKGKAPPKASPSSKAKGKKSGRRR